MPPSSPRPLTPAGERLLTGLLLSACLLIGAVAAAPRLAPRVSAPELERGEVVVHVHGQVHEPGTYALPWGSRVADLIAAAGGVTADADTALLALAATLTDGRSVVVPSRTSPDGEVGRIDLNTASQRLLTTLPGVGPVTAERIIAGRPYHRLEDLLRVPGIGPARLEALRERVTL